MTEYGVVYELDAERAFGLIKMPDYTSTTFLFREYEPASVPDLWTPVQFELAPHPKFAGREVAKKVRPATLKPLHGTVLERVPDRSDREGRTGSRSGVIVRLANGSEAWIAAWLPGVDRLSVGARVLCVSVPGAQSRQDVLAFQLVADEPSRSPRPSPGPTAASGQQAVLKPSPVGACTRKGTREGKSLNDDAFLVAQVGDPATWLLAVADGVSQPANGWWAADKCMELLWHTLPDFSQELARQSQSDLDMQAMMRRWIDRIHKGFRQFPKPVEFSNTASTLTFVIVQRDRFYWAHCGDTRIYTLDTKDKAVTSVLDESDIKSQRLGTNRISSHIGVPDREWRPLLGAREFPQHQILLLCTDGVIGGGRAFEKFNIIRELGPYDNLQAATEKVVQRIADIEGDDLTLVAFADGGV